MKKEELRERAKNRSRTMRTAKGTYYNAIPISELNLLINRLDEPEITPKQAWEVIAPRFSMEPKQLEESVVHGFVAKVSEEIEMESDRIRKLADGIKKLHAENEELKAKLDNPEKVVIPQFVADWIDAHDLHGNNPLREYRDLEIDFNEGWTNEKDAAVYHWVNENPYTFIDALRYGYEVEKEKLYYIYDKSTKGYLGYNADKTRLSWYTSMFPNDVFTEQEIKEIDERYWAFAEEVAE